MSIFDQFGGYDPVRALNEGIELNRAKREAEKHAAKVAELREIRKRDRATLERLLAERNAAREMCDQLLKACLVASEFWLSDRPIDTVEGDTARRILVSAIASGSEFERVYK